MLKPANPDHHHQLTRRERRQVNLWRVLQRSVYALAVFILLVLTLIQTGRCLKLFLDEPTYFETSVKLQNEVEFPSITVCPDDGGYKKDVLKVRDVFRMPSNLGFTYFDCSFTYLNLTLNLNSSILRVSTWYLTFVLI